MTIQTDIEQLHKWLNEEPNRPLDKAALARVLHEARRTQEALRAVAVQLRSASPEPCNCMASKHWPDCSYSKYTAALDLAQRQLSAWNEWYGQHGAGLPLPPAGIVKTQEALAEARSLLSA